MTIEEFIQKCRKRPIPKNPMARVQLLARELAEGASYELWGTEFSSGDYRLPKRLSSDFNRAFKEDERGKGFNDRGLHQQLTSETVASLNDMFTNGFETNKHELHLRQFLAARLAKGTEMYYEYLSKPLLMQVGNLGYYLLIRWTTKYPSFNLLNTSGFLTLSEKSSKFLLSKDAFNLLEEVNQVDIFISYKRSESSAFALLIEDRLKQYGLEPFLDKQLQAGDDWQAELKQNIQQSDYLIILLGQKTLESEVTVKEIQWALDADVTLIPIWHNKFEYKSGAWDSIPVKVDKALSNTHTIRVIEENPLTYDTALRELLNRFGISV